MGKDILRPALAVGAFAVALAASSGDQPDSVRRDNEGRYIQTTILERGASRITPLKSTLACPPKTDKEWGEALEFVGRTFGTPDDIFDPDRSYKVNNNERHPYPPNGRREVVISSDWGDMHVNISGGCHDGNWENKGTGVYGLMPTECYLVGIQGGVRCSSRIMHQAVVDVLNRATAGDY